MPTTTSKADPHGPPPRRRRGRAATRVNIAVLLLLAAALIVCGRALAGEIAVRHARLALDHARIGGHERSPVPGTPLPARAALLWALADARVAAALPAGRTRASLLAQADLFAGQAIRARPAWGAAAATRAYLRAVGGDEAGALAEYARSYRESGFLPEVAPWRIGWGLSRWRALDAATRGRLIDEAAWFSTRPQGYFPTMIALVGHPAEVPVVRVRARLSRLAEGVAPTN